MRPLKGSGLSADYPVRIPGAAPRSGPERSDRPLMFLEGTVINHRGQADVAHNKLPGPALNPGLRRRFFDLRLRLSDGSVDEFSFTGPHDLRVVRGDTVRVDGLVLTNLTSGDRWPVRDVGHGRPVRRPLQRPSVLAGPVSTYRWKTGLPVAAAVTGLAAVYGIGVGAAVVLFAAVALWTSYCAQYGYSFREPGRLFGLTLIAAVAAFGFAGVGVIAPFGTALTWLGVAVLGWLAEAWRALYLS